MDFLKGKKEAFDGGGLVLFAAVADAMQAERCLKRAGYQLRLVAPPPELRKGCDLALEINLTEQPGIERRLRQDGLEYVEVRPREVAAAPLDELVRTADYGDWVMVRVANMKLTYEKETGIIVNTSGGGCPDIPYLHAEMLGKRLDRAPRPGELGFTLCALMLERALEEGLAAWEGGRQ